MRDIRAGVVLAPESSAEAAEIMRAAATLGFPVRCSGARRAHSDEHAVVLSSKRLDRIAEYEPADLVVSVESGVTHSLLANRTAQHNQFLALDPAHAGAIGSTVARGAAGPLRLAHGTPRDQVLGLEIVAGDGRVLEFGGKVVKNVAGYDVVRVIVGSRGTLGFITRVNLRLKPLPACDRTAVLEATRDAAVDAAIAVRERRLDAAALELVSSARDRWRLLVRLHGNRAAVEDSMTQLSDIAAFDAAPDAAVAWSAVMRAEADAGVKLRLAHLPVRLHETVRAAEQLIEDAGLQDAWIAAHAGDGIVRVCARNAPAAAANAIARAQNAAADRGGTLIVERLDAGTPFRLLDAQTRELMRQIKAIFDPAGILGAGPWQL